MDKTIFCDEKKSFAYSSGKDKQAIWKGSVRRKKRNLTIGNNKYEQKIFCA
ncbi:unnamed protein product [Meloidogyne enterolobii]|uniref:Uncharacterized protein n=1 Tax=Meloidogyne enterolobii TaxID=390850 RepID=A0ACB0YQI9_MELEN